MSLPPCRDQRDHVPSPTNPSEGVDVDVDDEIERTMRDLHGDYDYGDDRVPTSVVASVSGSKQGERGDVKDDDEDDDEKDEEEDDEDEDQEEGERAGTSEAVNAADALALAALELRAREDKAAMDRLVVAMAGDGVVVWRHQSGFHKELVGDINQTSVILPTLTYHFHPPAPIAF